VIASQTASGLAAMSTSASNSACCTLISPDIARSSLLSRQRGLERQQLASGRRGEWAHPALIDRLDRNRVEVIDPLAASSCPDHETGLDEDRQMVHDPEAAHTRDEVAQLTGRSRGNPELIEQSSPRLVGHCVEHRVFSVSLEPS
jgi:hypothetical protein